MRERTKYESFQKEQGFGQTTATTALHKREMKKYVCIGGAQKNQRKWQCLSVMYKSENEIIKMSTRHCSHTRPHSLLCSVAVVVVVVVQCIPRHVC